MVINANSWNIQDQCWYFDILIPDEPILFNAERKKIIIEIDAHESYTKAQKLRAAKREKQKKKKKKKLRIETERKWWRVEEKSVSTSSTPLCQT